MAAPDLDTPELPEYGTDFFADGGIPETLEPLFDHIAGEIFPELTGKLAFMDAYVRRVQPEDGQPVSEKPHQRYNGEVDTLLRGVPVAAGVQLYLLYILRRADAVLQAATESERASVLSGLKRYRLDGALPGI